MEDPPAQLRFDSPEARARRRLTLPQILAGHARTRPDAVAFSFLPDGETVDTQLTFAQLDGRARTIASHLADQAGERAVLLYPSSAEFVAALFGCLYAGVVAVHAPLVASTPERTVTRLEVVAGNSDAALVLSTRDVADQQSLFVAHDSPLRAVPWLASDELAADPTARPSDARNPAPQPDHLALIQFTSGTTGTARGIPLTHQDLVLQADRLYCGSEPDPDGVIVGWTPLFHDMGLFASVIAPVLSGRHSVVIFPLAFLGRPICWLESITRFGATASGGPNFAYDLVVRRLTPDQLARLDLSSWRTAFIGGEQVRPATLDRFARAFAPAGFDPQAFSPCYGLAEATCLVTGRLESSGPGVRSFDPDALRQGLAIESPGGHQITSLGYAYQDLRWLIVDPETRAPVPDGQIGELWIAGPGVVSGYWQEPDDTAQVFGARLADGDGEPGDGPFLRTGDLAFRLEDELFAVGRIKELIIIRGRNVYPHDVEATVQASHPALRPGCGAAFAVDGEEGEALIVAQELRRGTSDDPDDIKRAITAAVRADHEIDTHAVLLLPPGSVPKTTSGKIQRKLCRIHYLQGVWPAPSAP